MKSGAQEAAKLKYLEIMGTVPGKALKLAQAKTKARVTPTGLASVEIENNSFFGTADAINAMGITPLAEGEEAGMAADAAR